MKSEVGIIVVDLGPYLCVCGDAWKNFSSFVFTKIVNSWGQPRRGRTVGSLLVYSSIFLSYLYQDYITTISKMWEIRAMFALIWALLGAYWGTEQEGKVKIIMKSDSKIVKCRN